MDCELCAIIDCILPLFIPLLARLLPTYFGTLQSNDSSEILVKAQSTYKKHFRALAECNKENCY